MKVQMPWPWFVERVIDRSIREREERLREASNTDAVHELRALADAEFEIAKRNFDLVTYFYAAGLSIAVGAAFVPVGPVLIGVGLLSLFPQLLAWWEKYRGQRRQSYAQQMDWRHLLMDSLGETPDDVREVARLEAGATTQALNVVPGLLSNADDYFQSKKPFGIERLRENLLETGFFTEQLYRRCARRVLRRFWMLAISVVSSAVLMLIFLPSGSSAKLLLLLLGFLPTWDAYGRGTSWQWAAERLCRANLRLLTTETPERFMTLYGDMVVACAGVPPTPPAIYRKACEELNREWARQATTLDAATARQDGRSGHSAAPAASPKGGRGVTSANTDNERRSGNTSDADLSPGELH